jgi:kinesin family protein 5
MTGAGARANFSNLETSSLRVVADPRRGVWPRGAAEILLGDDVDIDALLDTANARRSTGATDLNKDSSRSHLIVVLRMETDACHSKLFLVDLAGCEQVRKSGAAGSRLDEACGINKSLSALGNVVAALTAANKTHATQTPERPDEESPKDGPARGKKKIGTHVPYRDSKLTFLLSEALGGNARAVLVTCLSPNTADAPETLSTLRFGVRARQIVAKPRRNMNVIVDGHPTFESTELIAELRARVAFLQKRLHAENLAEDDSENALFVENASLKAHSTKVRVKPMPTIKLWIGLCVAYFAVDALALA